MATIRNSCCNLRLACLIIGYTSLVAAILDIVSHLLFVSYISNGFQCDVDIRRLESIEWLAPILMFLNIGTHGFYPFPIAPHSYLPLDTQPACYPGMLHVYQVDVLNLLINAIWLRFVISYIQAVHKKDSDEMKMFLGLSMLKLVVQILYYTQFLENTINNNFEAIFLFRGIKVLDICIASIFLLIIYNYIKQLKREAQGTEEQPPTYIECLINSATQNKMKENKNTVSTIELSNEEKKIYGPSDANSERV